jgi:HEAT repeat protein
MIGPEPVVARLRKAGLSESSLVNTDFGAPRRGEQELGVDPADVLVALLTSALSLAVLVYGMSAIASVPIFIALHLAVLVVPAIFLRMRLRDGGELTVPVLLLVATFAAGPVGALGCAAMALALWRQNPSPTRLQDWYDYIAGVVARTRLTRIYDELASGRLPSDPTAKVPRFGPILEGASVEQQQRVLGVIGRRYHAEFRPVLRKALRNSNGFIRAQAAAVASGLDAEEKNRLWSSDQNSTVPAASPALDVKPREP